MIARIWHGRTKQEQAEAYWSFLQKRAVEDYQSVPGNRAVHILRRDENDVCHFITFTLWDNLEAIHAFAGEDVERAKYYPEDEGFLLEFEPTVTHYEVSEG